MANTEHGFIVSILRAPGALAGTMASPVWERKAHDTGYHTTYGSLEAAKDFSLDNVNKEIFVLRKGEKKDEESFYEAYKFVDIQDRIKEGKIKKDDFILLDVNQARPARAASALEDFEFDWKVEKKEPEGAALVEAITAAVIAAVKPPAPAPAPVEIAEMQQMRVQMKQMAELIQRLEKQSETLLAEKEVKQANPIK